MSSSDLELARRTLSRAGWLAGEAPGLADALLQHGSLVRYATGQWAQAEGDPDTGLFVVVEGAVQMYCQAPGDREVLVGHAEAGAAIGQTMRFGGGPRLVTAICVAPSLLLLVPDAALERIGRSRPDIWRAVASLVYAQLRTAIRLAAELAALPPRQRLASRLRMLARTGGGRGPVTLHLSQHALAEMIGVTRKTVNLQLSAFARAGLVEIGYGRLTIRDVAGLDRVAEG
ncbi:MAG: Crp/Fnr family transcriptional regulator [Alphaproteobacteria bacterium]|nr:Crp/Fnr family transcriptional regulator [Alphaproteobacteria bacterium]